MHALAVSGVKKTDCTGLAMSSADEDVVLGEAKFWAVNASLEEAAKARRRAFANLMVKV